MSTIEIGMPFDFDSTAPDPEEYQYSAAEERMFNISSWTNGVFPQVRIVKNNILQPDTYVGQSLFVQPNDSGLGIKVSPGMAIVEGTKYLLMQTKPISFEQENVARIFDIVVELDLVNQKIKTKAQQRSTGLGLADVLIRTNGIYQIAIATVNIPANASLIQPVNITDQRLNTTLATADNKPICGLVGSSMQADTRMIHEQYMAQLNLNQDEFNSWFATVKETLDGDTAGNLLNLITELQGKFNSEGKAIKAIEADTAKNGTYTLTHSKVGTVHTSGNLPTAPGLYTANLTPTADYAEGDTWADGWTAELQGSGEPLPNEAFKAGKSVTILVDTVGKKLGFKLGGGTAKFNIFPQLAEPSATDGVWIKDNIFPTDIRVVSSNELAQPNSWRASPVMPNRFTGTTVRGCLYQSKIYAFGRLNSENQCVQIYDLHTKMWTSGGISPESTYAPYGCYHYVNIIYVVFNVTNLLVHAYDPETGLWTTKAKHTASVSYSPAVEGVDRFIFVVGGRAGGYLKTVYAYDILSNSWSSRSPMSYGREDLTLTRVGTILYAMGGYNSDATPYTKTFNEAYDTNSDMWTTKQVMSQGKYAHSAASVGNIVYCSGGYIKNTSESPSGQRSTLAYDTQTNLWSSKTSMPDYITYGQAVVNNSTIHFLGLLMHYEYYPIGSQLPDGTLVVPTSLNPNGRVRIYKNKKIDIVLCIDPCIFFSNGQQITMPTSIRIDSGIWTNL